MHKTNLVVQVLEQGVGLITLDRPERGNSLTPEMVSGLRSAFAQFEEDPKVRVIVITGKGKHFCTGMDLGFKNQQHMQEQLKQGAQVAEQGQKMFAQIHACSKPVISKINGGAMGGGWGIVFATDIRIAMESATFCFAEVKSGLVPALISAFIVPQMSSFVAKELMLTGRTITAREAHRLGLLTAVARDEQELNALAVQFADECLANSPIAMKNVKQLVSFLVDHNSTENDEHVRQVFLEMFNNKQALYGMQCIARRQKPDWSVFTTSKL